MQSVHRYSETQEFLSRNLTPDKFLTATSGLSMLLRYREMSRYPLKKARDIDSERIQELLSQFLRLGPFKETEAKVCLLSLNIFKNSEEDGSLFMAKIILNFPFLTGITPFARIIWGQMETSNEEEDLDAMIEKDFVIPLRKVLRREEEMERARMLFSPTGNIFADNIRSAVKVFTALCLLDLPQKRQARDFLSLFETCLPIGVARDESLVVLGR